MADVVIETPEEYEVALKEFEFLFDEADLPYFDGSRFDDLATAITKHEDIHYPIGGS